MTTKPIRKCHKISEVYNPACDVCDGCRAGLLVAVPNVTIAIQPLMTVPNIVSLDSDLLCGVYVSSDKLTGHTM